MIDTSVVGNVPKKGPQLIISNHPGILDTLLLYSIAERDDLYFIAIAEYGLLGAEFRKFLLPIFRKRRKRYFLYKLLAKKLSEQNTDYFKHKMSNKKILEKNRTTIMQASKLINNNHAVSIFPTGSVGKSIKIHRWKPGVGFLIKQITNPNTKIVFANIKGTKKSEVLSFFHPIIKKLFYQPEPLGVIFSKSYELGDLIDQNDDAKQITKVLEQKYELFAHST